MNPGDIAFDEARHAPIFEAGAAEVVGAIDPVGVEQPGDPGAAGEAVEFGRGRLFGGELAQSIVAIVAVASGAIVGEQPRSLKKGILADERQCAGSGNAGGGGSESPGAAPFASGVGQGGLKVTVTRIEEPGGAGEGGGAEEEGHDQGQVEEVAGLDRPIQGMSTNSPKTTVGMTTAPQISDWPGNNFRNW